MSERIGRAVGVLLGAIGAVLILTFFVWNNPSSRTFASDPLVAGGTAGVYLVDSTADLENMELNDDDVVILGTPADGGMLLYQVSSTATVDNIIVYNGPGGRGRFLRINSGDSTLVYDMGSQTGSATIPWNTYNGVALDLTGDTKFVFTDPASARWLTLVITQTAPGGYIINWPTLSGGTPVVDGTSGATTVVLLFFDGTNYHVF